MMNVESLAQPRFDFLLDLRPALQVGRLHHHVRFERPLVLVQFPQVQVMNFGDALDRLQFRKEFVRIHVGRCAPP